MADYTFKLTEGGTQLLITIGANKFDASCVSGFKQQLEETWQDTIIHVDIDFFQVDFIDSSGIGALLGVQKRLRGDGQPIRVLNAKPNVVSVIELLRLHRVFSISE
ncbi:STAS domain-containing protein [Ruficoccus amylovorans]|uniref:STAS domain-containing protein n=1 Tax=Ruficoccus amylovorans TaxID=1804625 RepID=A0A842HJ31_9BACT|nr:STAS domain-containing protein [Ruficoccus amylovorans]MBC2596432.1 STAS domain-containing protein [Ruficoccus amylovorans]